MPLYDYECQSCGSQFDTLRKTTDEDHDVECPKCHEKNAHRVFSLTASDIKMLKSSCSGGGRPMRFG
jgi:putative FmdB family regulatory protein